MVLFSFVFRLLVFMIKWNESLECILYTFVFVEVFEMALTLGNSSSWQNKNWLSCLPRTDFILQSVLIQVKSVPSLNTSMHHRFLIVSHLSQTNICLFLIAFPLWYYLEYYSSLPFLNYNDRKIHFPWNKRRFIWTLYGNNVE